MQVLLPRLVRVGYVTFSLSRHAAKISYDENTLNLFNSSINIQTTRSMINTSHIESNCQDYPSIGQLNDILIKNQVIPIFAVTKDMQDVYKDLSGHLTQLSSVG